jgi:protease-4
MTGLSFTGYYFMQELFVDRMTGIVLPRLNAGQEPFPSIFQKQAQAAAVMAADPDRRQKQEQRRGRFEALIDAMYDDDGFFNQDRYDLYQYRKAGGGSVAVIPIDGPMARVGYCGIGGNEYVARILALAALDPNVKAVVLKMNTPGGTVDSTRMLADLVASFPKLIYVWTPFCASAGYYVASQSDMIWLEDQSVSEVGSIGVLMVYQDQSKALEKAGIDITIFRADGSEKKAQGNGIEPLTPAVKAQIQLSLNECRTEFLGYVRRGRAGKLTSDDAFSGEMFNQVKSQELGLIDRVGTLEACISHALLNAA